MRKIKINQLFGKTKIILLDPNGSGLIFNDIEFDQSLTKIGILLIDFQNKKPKQNQSIFNKNRNRLIFNQNSRLFVFYENQN